MLAWLGSLSKSRRWMTIGGGAFAIFLLGALSHDFHLRSPFGSSGEGGAVNRPEPAEFLYLDNERVGAYLAQLNGGIATSERLTETLRREDSAKVSGGNLFEVGASAQHENFVERQVTPTAAASFFRLLAMLLQQNELKDVSVRNFIDFEELPEGSFVRFRSRDLLTPVYANSYLVVRQACTLKALFPTAGLDSAEREEVEHVREAARNYAHQVGPNPRVIFALTPMERKSEEEERKKMEEGSPEARKEAERRRKNNTIKFLLPVRYRQLTDERSLIKDGGGRFTVVGKLVRTFKGRLRGTKFAYRDSPTLETWKKPLEEVPRRLLQRSSYLCGGGEGERSESGSGASLRRCVLKRLKQQTEIPKRGAVILPVAIYK